jgi:flavin-binding protein dodecin
MSKDRNRHVVPNSEGGWDVTAPGASRASSHQDTQAEAIDRAREIVHNLGGGEVVIHDRHNRIRDSDTVAPGNDPNPPHDRR